MITDTSFFVAYPELTTQILEKLEIKNYKCISIVSKFFNQISNGIYKKIFLDNDVKILFRNSTWSDNMSPTAGNILNLCKNLSSLYDPSVKEKDQKDPFEELRIGDIFKTHLTEFTFLELSEAQECYSKQAKIMVLNETDFPGKTQKMLAICAEFFATEVGKSFNVKKITLMLNISKERLKQSSVENQKRFEEVVTNLEHEVTNLEQQARNLQRKAQTYKFMADNCTII